MLDAAHFRKYGVAAGRDAVTEPPPEAVGPTGLAGAATLSGNAGLRSSRGSPRRRRSQEPPQAGTPGAAGEEAEGGGAAKSAKDAGPGRVLPAPVLLGPALPPAAPPAKLGTAPGSWPGSSGDGGAESEAKKRQQRDPDFGRPRGEGERGRLHEVWQDTDAFRVPGLRKTEMCSFWLRAACKRGASRYD